MLNGDKPLRCQWITNGETRWSSQRSNPQYLLDPKEGNRYSNTHASDLLDWCGHDNLSGQAIHQLDTFDVKHGLKPRRALVCV